MSLLYPLFLDLAGKPVLLLGAGKVGGRKLEELVRCGAAITVIAPRLEAAAARFRTRVRVLEREYRPGDEEGFFLVLAATDDAALNARVAETCRERGILCNVSSEAERGDCIVPSVLRNEEVTVAFSTGHAVPALSRLLKGRLREALDGPIGLLARLLGAWRRERKAAQAENPGAEAFPAHAPLSQWLALLETQGPEKGAEALAEALRRFEDGRFEEGSASGPSGKPERPAGLFPVALVGCGPGHPGLMTLRARQVIEEADVLVHDRLIPVQVLGWAKKECLRFEVGKKGHGDSARQEEIEALLIRHAREGKKVARLKGGDPFIFGRGLEEIEALEAAGLTWTLIPGVSSATGVPAFAGISLTHRGLARSFAVMTGTAGSEANLDIPKADTVVVLMGLHHLAALARAFIDRGYAADTPLALLSSGTLPAQRVLFSTLEKAEGDAAAAALPSPALLVVGKVVALAAGRSPPSPLPGGPGASLY